MERVARAARAKAIRAKADARSNRYRIGTTMSNAKYVLTSDGSFVREDELYHWSVLGMKWGVRRYQNPDGSLTEAWRRRLEKADYKWAKKKTDKITAKAKKTSQKELNAYGKELLKLPGDLNSSGKLSAQTVNAYNRKMAELMSQKTSDIRAPSGRVVSFVAKRGEVGAFMALSNSGYDPNQYRQGVYSSGRIAYKKDHANKIDI